MKHFRQNAGSPISPATICCMLGSIVYYLNQWLLTVHWILSNKLAYILIKIYNVSYRKMYVTISAYGSRSSQGITGFNYMAHIIDSITLFILRIYQLVREIDFMSLVWIQMSTPELAAYDPCLVIIWFVFSGMHLSNHVCCIYSIKISCREMLYLYRFYLEDTIPMIYKRKYPTSVAII